MSIIRLLQIQRTGWCWFSLLGLWLPASSFGGVDTNAPPVASTNAPPKAVAKPAPEAPFDSLTAEQMFEGGTNTYNNWIDFAAGGVLTTGNKAQFQQTHHTAGNAFGGIEDFHYQGDLAKGTSLSIDGHALFDNEDYKLTLGVVREKLGYLRFNYNEFRTYYNGDGGFYPPTDQWYAIRDNPLALDRGELSFEAGLTLEKAPKVTFKYTHAFRDGEKDSTIWGLTHPAGSSVVRGLSPTINDINEHSDIFQLDATHHIKSTDLGLGVRYESGKLNNALKIDQFPGEPSEQKITDRQGTTYDLFNVHAFTESWIKKNLLFSSGFLYSTLENEFSGSRIYGTDFDVGYVPSAQNGTGYNNLSGSSHQHEYALDLNLMANPSQYLSIVPSVRVQKEDMDANSTGLETLSNFSPTLFDANSDRGVLDVRERLDLTYKGFTNWVLYARGELTEGSGNLTENGGIGLVNGIGVPPIQRETDDERFFQKYSAGARWYPSRRVIFDAGGYYKLNRYDYDHTLDSTPNDSFNRYPAYLVMQDFETYDGNVRLTLRPRQNVSLVTRYEYQLSTIHTEPDSISGLSELQSSKMNSQIIAQDVSWSPSSRLYLQAGFNYVLSETKTPASEQTQAILNSQNNYWTLNFSSGLVLDAKTDLNLSYFYYQADNYQNNADFGVPLGAGGQENAVKATVIRRLSKNLRITFSYGYYNYDDALSGGNNNYSAHVLYTSLRYRF